MDYTPEQSRLPNSVVKQCRVAACMLVLSCLLVACSDSDDPFGATITPTIPPADDSVGGGALSCTGNRVWTTGMALEQNPRFEVLFSEGGQNFDVSPNSVTPCAVVWLLDASQGCSLIFTTESFFAALEQPVPPGLTLTTSGANLILASSGNTPDTLQPSGISLQQLNSAPDC